MTGTGKWRAAVAGTGLGAVLLAGAAFGGEMGHWESGHGPRAMMRSHMPIHMLDADKDGNVTRKEVTRKHQEGIKSFDGNGDGRLTLDEYEGLWLQQNRRRMVRHFQSFDLDGDGLVTAAEMDEHADHLFRRLDTDGNGTISAQEIREGHRPHRVRMMHRHLLEGEDEGDRRRKKP